MKGIILAGGTGTRLYPVTTVVSKQLLPVFDKPMIYYPLSTLMLGGIRDILIISTPQDQPAVPAPARRRLRTRTCSFSYAVAGDPARTGGRLHRWCASSSETTRVALVLGDNIFHGHGLPEMLAQGRRRAKAARPCSATSSTRPEQYGVVELDASRPRALDRGKAEQPKSNVAVTGLISTTTTWSTSPRSHQAVAARRARDHRRQPGLSRTRRPLRRSSGPRLCLAGHRHPRLAGRGQPFRADPRAAPGLAHRLSRGDRAAAAATSRSTIREAGAAVARRAATANI